MFEDKLISALKEYELNYSDEIISNFSDFYKMVIEWNERMNLTAITEEEEFIAKHILDSLSVIKSMKKYDLLSEDNKILDLGTGAGFPGIPLKIYANNLNITLMDALQKRINFLNEVIKELRLGNIATLHQRAEEISQTNLRETFETVLSRAVAALPTLLEYALPFVKVGGFFIAWKGCKANEEVELSKNALKTLGGKITDIIDVKIPNLNEERALIIVKKDRTTPLKYPRQSGAPKKKPL